MERKGTMAKLLASVLAGTLCFASAPIQLAWAQPKPPPKPPTAPAPKPPVAPLHAAAPAGPTPAQLREAKKHYEDGEKKYKAGEYAAALKEFEAADSIKGTPQTARFLGLCHDGLGHYPEAVTWYEKFLNEPPKTPTAAQQANLDEIRGRVAKIKALPGKVHIETTPAGATVMVDGQAQTQPTPADIEVPPGKHVIRLSLEGRIPQDKEIEVAFASKQDLQAELEAKPPPPAPPPPVTPPPPPPQPATPPPPPPEERSKVPAYVTGGLAIAAAGVGTVFGVMALGDKSDFDKEPNTSPKKKGFADDGDNHALIADMAFAAALTLGITSVVLFVTKDEPPATAGGGRGRAWAARPKKSTITVTPAPIVTPTGGGAGAIIRF